jgi:hypothetical protein
MAARVAERASSMRCFFSLSSTSVAAPTLTTATPPASLARRSCSFSRSQSGVGVVDLALDLRDAALHVVLGAAPSTIGGVSLVTTTLRAAEQVERGVVELEADLLGDDLPAGEDGEVLEHRLAALAEARALTATELNVPRILLTRGWRGLALDVLGD